MNDQRIPPPAYPPDSAYEGRTLIVEPQFRWHGDGRVTLPFFPENVLRSMFDTVLQETKSTDPKVLATYMAVCAVKYCFGQEWWDTHVSNRSGGGFLCVTEDNLTSTYRTEHLGGLILGLIRNPLIASALQLVATGEIQSGLSELEVVKLLMDWGLNPSFRFPLGTKGENYDYQITFRNGQTGCCEVKCKEEGPAFNGKSLKTSLDHARNRNLPPDKPSVVFAKVPSTWMPQPSGAQSELAEVGEAFLKSTERVVGVLFYSSSTTPEAATLPVLQIMNRKHRFSIKTGWEVLTGVQERRIDFNPIRGFCVSELRRRGLG